MNNKFFVALLTVLAIIILTILSYKENGIKTYPSYKTSSMHGFRLTHKEDNKVKWELTSEDATFPEGNEEVILNNLTMKIYHNREITLTGGSGIYRLRDKNLTINKPIVIDIEGDRLTTDSLTWNGDEDMITTDDRIKFKGKNFIIEGTGLSAKTRNQQIKVLEDVKGIFYR